MYLSQGNKKNNHIVIFFLWSVLSFILNELFNNIVLLNIFFTFTVLLSISLFNYKKKFSDPRVVLPGFYYLYHTWYFYSVSIGRDMLFFDHIEQLVFDSLLVSYFGLLVLVNSINLLFSIKGRDYSVNEYEYINETKYATFKAEVILWNICFIVSTICLVYVYTSGAASKLDITRLGVIPTIGYYSTLILNILSLLRIVRLPIDLIYKDRIIFFTLIYFIFYLLVSGERDIPFRFMISCLIIYTMKSNNFGFFKVLSFLMLVIIVVPISQLFKAIAVSSFNFNELSLLMIFSNEFISTSRNLYSILYFGHEQSDFVFIITDIIRAFVPNSLIENYDIISTNKWFNSEYRVLNGFNGSAGWGLGLVPQGVLVGGYLGVTLLMSIVGVIIGFLYMLRTKSEYYLLFYILALTVSIYCFRADLANYLSQIFKINGTAFFIIIFFSTFIKRLSK